MTFWKKGSLLLGTVLLLAACGSGGSDSKQENTANAFKKTEEIHVITREAGSGTRGAFIELVGLEEKQADGSKKDMITKDANVENNTNTVLSSVQQDLYGMGYISLGSLNDSVKALHIDGVAPSGETVKSGQYPIARPFNIATKGDAQGLVKDFIQFILSQEGQEIASKSYVSVVDQAKPFQSDNSSGKLTIGGSSSVAPLMEKLVEAYKKINSQAEIELQISDSTTGMTKTIEGAYDIGMSSRSLKDKEKAALKDLKIALDGIVVIVNKNNPINDLTKENIKNIYNGTITSFESLVKE